MSFIKLRIFSSKRKKQKKMIIYIYYMVLLRKINMICYDLKVKIICT